MDFFISDTNNFKWKIGDHVNGLNRFPIFPCMKIRIYELTDYILTTIPPNTTISNSPYGADHEITVGSTIYIPFIISGFDFSAQQGLVVNGLYIEASTGLIYYRIQNTTSSEKTISNFKVRVVFISKYSDNLMPQGYDQ